MAALALWAAGAAPVSEAAAQAPTGQQCAPERVTGRGEASRYLWLAKVKARANWRSRVRGMPGLGAAFATWSRARDPDETCQTGPAGTVCSVSALPCRS